MTYIHDHYIHMGLAFLNLLFDVTSENTGLKYRIFQGIHVCQWGGGHRPNFSFSDKIQEKSLD